MCRRTDQAFLQRRHADGQQAYEKMFNSTNHQRKANQNYNEIPSCTCQSGYHQKEHKYLTNGVEDVEKKELAYTAGGKTDWWNTMENIY